MYFEVTKIRKTLVAMILLLTLFASCRTDNSQQTGTDQVVTPPKFSVAVETNTAQETRASLMVINSGNTPFPGSDDFNAEMVLWTAEGEPRARIEANVIQSIGPDETIYLSSGYWKLDPGVYFLTWGAPDYGGNVTIFSVIENSGRLNLGSSVSFNTKPFEYEVQAASAGSIQSFSKEVDGPLTIRGETSLPDTKCVFPILYGNEGVVEGFPVGTCAQIAEGQWQITLPPDPGGTEIQLKKDVNYQAILFSEDLTLPPSEPFSILISPPPQN